MTSASGSDSASFSSSQAIVAHFDEAAGVLADGGFPVSDQAWDSIARALREETIDEISFWAVNPANEQDGRALLRLKIDWSTHAVAVEGGDAVDLPLREGTIHLRQVRRAAMAFLVAYQQKGLRGSIRLNYRPAELHRSDELNTRYGWTYGTEIKQEGNGSGSQLESRYHAAVSLEWWYAD